MKEIPLTQGKVALVDDEDYDWLNQWKWQVYKVRTASTCYAIRSITLSPGRCSTIRMHREIMGHPMSKDIDHINSDGLDNRRCNLRLATRAENRHNSRLYRNNTSGYKGVSVRDNCSRYEAYIKLHRKIIYVGSFPTAIEAARAYDAKARELFGEFARPNFPE